MLQVVNRVYETVVYASCLLIKSLGNVCYFLYLHMAMEKNERIYSCSNRGTLLQN